MIEGKQKMLKKVPYFDFHCLLLLKYKSIGVKQSICPIILQKINSMKKAHISRTLR